MKKVDYIIVGLGIAGISFAEHLLIHNKSFVVISDGSNGATNASGGVLNPTVLKRFTAAWNAAEFIDTAIPFYKAVGKRLGAEIVKSYPVLRILNSVEEQNNWMVASDKHELSRFLSSELLKNENHAINAPFGLGLVKESATINPVNLLKLYRDYLNEQGWLISEVFHHNDVEISEDKITYRHIESSKIVFAEGSGVIHNPLFPLSISPKGQKVFVPNKGSYVIIKAAALKCEGVLKGGMMLIPLGHDLYKVGASYGRDEVDTEPTQSAQDYITEKLDKMICCDYEVVDQVVGVRPTIKDRKPVIGSLSSCSHVAFLNGLGTRGLSMAPLLSKSLYDYLENNIDIPAEMDLNRFL